MQIHQTTNLEHQFLKILPYGGPGSGKTTFAGSMARRVKVLGLSAEAGLLSLQHMKDEAGKVIPVDYVKIEKYEDIQEAYHFLRSSKHDYLGVFLDSLTDIQTSCKDHIMSKTGKDMEMRDWGVLATKIEGLVRNFRDLPMHVVVTALEDTEVDKLTGEVKVYPSLQGSMQKKLAAYFDEVFYMTSKEVGEGEARRIRHFALTRNSGKYVGKDRSGKLPQWIPDPDFATVYDLVYKGDK